MLSLDQAPVWNPASLKTPALMSGFGKAASNG